MAAHSAPGNKIKVALVGCGGRGKADLKNFLAACKILGLTCEVVALADAFEGAVKDASEKFNGADDRCHVGFDAYHKVAGSDAEYVLLVTPPIFRPLHLEAMLNAGKNVFVEKPVAVDAPGCRKVIELGEVAKSKGLGISAGMQCRHAAKYLKNKALVDAGAIGETTEVNPEQIAKDKKGKPSCRRLNLTDGSKKPLGEWNQMRIVANGSGIEVFVNGTLVNKGWNSSVTEGAICLQAEKANIQFRNIRIKE